MDEKPVVVKAADEKYIKAEERKYLGAEVGSMFVGPTKILAGYDSIDVKLIAPLSKEAYPEWVKAAMYSSLATWDREPFNVATKLLDAPFEEQEERLKGILADRRISAALEGITFNYKVIGVPRSFTAQYCRHRKAAFGEMSMRVASNYSEAVRVPQSLLNMPDGETRERLLGQYFDVVNSCKRLYRDMIEEGIPMEQARNITPIGTLTKIGSCWNLASLIDYFGARTSDIAQDEHTLVTCLMAKELRDKQPKFFNLITELWLKKLPETMAKYGIKS